MPTSSPNAHRRLRNRTIILPVVAFLVPVALFGRAIFFSAPDPPDLPHTGRIGDELSDEWLVYRVKTVRCGLRPDPDDPRPEPQINTYCEVNVEVHSPRADDMGWSTTLKAGSAQYGVDHYLNTPDDLPPRLRKDEHRTFTLLFQLPANTRAADTLEFRSLGDRAAIVRL